MCEEQFGLANPYLTQLQNVVAFENCVLQLFDQIYDARQLALVMEHLGRCRTLISLKLFTKQTIQDTMDKTRAKIIKESR